jgi:hypothetical protein
VYRHLIPQSLNEYPRAKMRNKAPIVTIVRLDVSPFHFLQIGVKATLRYPQELNEGIFDDDHHIPLERYTAHTPELFLQKLLNIS